MLRRALNIYETVHGPNHSANASLRWLAECLNGQTRSAEAAAAVTQETAICETLGDEEGISAAAMIRAKIGSATAERAFRNRSVNQPKRQDNWRVQWGSGDINH